MNLIQYKYEVLFARYEKLKSFSAHANHHILNVISLYKENTRIVKANCTPTLEMVHGVVKENRYI